jgi:hypothetical protein
MHKSPSRILAFVAVAQFVPLILFPWSLSVTSLVVLVILLGLCVLLGWALMRRKWWGRTLTIFVQGLNVIVRVITLFNNVYTAGVGFDIPLLITYVLSVIISVIILAYVDRPEVQLVFES